MDNSALAPAIVGIFVLVCIVIALVPAIFYLLTLQKTLNKCAPGARTMEPGMVWLLLIPIFGIVWHFLIVTNMAKSLAAEFARRGVPSPEPTPGQPIGMAMCICICCGIIPFLGILASLAGLALGIVYWIKIAGYSKLLDVPQAVAPGAPIA
jgi:hypothetical protein